MTSGISGSAGPLLGTLFDAGTAAGLSDRDLVDRFLATGDPGAESAFAGLVERHGPMVLRVCRDVLRDPHDADDAFQATFLILARRAGSIRRLESVGPWLYGVALRVARCARKVAWRRREIERRGVEMRPEGGPGEAERLDAAPILHEEVGRLPERYRAAVVLCYFEGLTHEQAAGQLGWPVGTVRSRLAWARDRLRGKLIRRGLVPSAAFLGASAGSITTSAPVPAALAAAAVGMAMRAGGAGAVPASVAALAGRTLRVMTMTKLKFLATGLVSAGLVASAGVGLVSGRQQAGPQQDEQKTAGTSSNERGQAPRLTTNDPAADPSRDVPATAGGSASGSPRVLFVRLKSALALVQIRRRLHETGQGTFAETLAAQSEVDALQAQLEARGDELRDQIELLKAQLAIREADVTTAEAEIQPAAAKLAFTERLLQKHVISDSEAGLAKQEVAIRTAERDKKQAEAAEVRVRISQATRQLKTVEGLIKEANDLIAKAAPKPVSPGVPAPPPPPR